MAESMNTKADLVVNGISYMGLNSYGKIMIGDRAFEFYNDRTPNDFIQIPWEEIDRIEADVLFGGKWIPRFAIITKRNGIYRFGASRNTKRLLAKCRDYFPADRIVHARDAIRVSISAIKNIFNKNKTK